MTSGSVVPSEDPALQWYAVRVRPHCERIADLSISSKGYQHYLPLVRSRRRWADRIKELELPLFPGYVFGRFDAAHRVPILECSGVAGVVGFGGQCIAIPAEEIESIQRIMESSLPVEGYPFVTAGQKIRIEYGPLAGVEGVVVEVKSRFRLVASVTLLQRSVSVEIDREWACPISERRVGSSLVQSPVISHARH